MHLTTKNIYTLGKGEHTDDKITGLKLRVTRGGSRSFYLFYRADGRRKKYRIGSADIGLRSARLAAKKIKGQIANGSDPQQEKIQAQEQSRKELTLRAFLDKHYYPAAKQTQKSFNYTQKLLERKFKFLHNRKMSTITASDIQQWQTRQLSRGIQPQTVNRNTTAIRSVCSRAVDLGVLETSPFARLRPLKTRKGGVIRFLDDDERSRLLAVLRSRGYTCATTIIWTLYCTGARPKEIKSLKWSAVDLDTNQITLHASYTKTNTTRIAYINDTLHAVLSEWRDKCSGDGWVFPDGNRYVTDISYEWRKIRDEAQLENFRCYDLRHSYASTLVQKGVSLFVVQKLLGHSNPAQTMTYAHLADSNMQDAVKLLD